MLTLIVAAARDGAIGRNGSLLWHISDDLRRFRLLTTGHTVVMGRKTWESIPRRPLPRRRNIVITRDAQYSAPGAIVAHSLDDALSASVTDGMTFIIGGESIYRQALPLCDTIRLTLVDALFPDADAFFPLPEPHLWHCTEDSGPLTDPQSGLSYRYQTLIRRTE